jgi:hypothetical protein
MTSNDKVAIGYATPAAIARKCLEEAHGDIARAIGVARSLLIRRVDVRELAGMPGDMA